MYIAIYPKRADTTFFQATLTEPASKRRKLSENGEVTTLIPTQPEDDDEESWPTSESAEGTDGKPSWDCTGLVPRYTHHADMPKNIQKCESPIIFPAI